MRLQSLTLQQFRNYDNQVFTWPEGESCMFLGLNGSGKTNVIEAIGLLSLLTSCRGAADEDMVKWGTDFYRVRAECLRDDGRGVTVEVVSLRQPRRKKAAFVNDVQRSLSSVIGELPTVTFLPQDLTLFSGAPAERRRFLDECLCQLSPEYVRELMGYQKVLQQRNALLKRISTHGESRDALSTWDDALVSHASYITLSRLQLMETINLSIGSELVALGEKWDDAHMEYVCPVSGTESEIHNRYRELLLERQERDLILQTTTVGPHREDWKMLCEGRDIQTFASRGQERTAVLALLFLYVSYLDMRKEERPIVLLDDAFSELDDAHQERLLSELHDHQVILTGTRFPDAGGDMRIIGTSVTLPQATMSSR